MRVGFLRILRVEKGSTFASLVYSFILVSKMQIAFIRFGMLLLPPTRIFRLNFEKS